MENNCCCDKCECKNLSSGTYQLQGTYSCKNCGQKIYLDANKELPKCPRCGFDVFTKQ